MSFFLITKLNGVGEKYYHVFAKKIVFSRFFFTYYEPNL